MKFKHHCCDPILSWTNTEPKFVASFHTIVHEIINYILKVGETFIYKLVITQPDFIDLDVSISIVRRSLFSSSSGSCDGNDTT